jgi:hypothetical protein
MSARRYVVLTLEDAHLVSGALARTRAHRGALGPGGSGELTDDQSGHLGAIYDRLNVEEGADMEEIVAALKKTPTCFACENEGQTSSCQSIETRKLGRRLNRLLERARGERAPGPHTGSVGKGGAP